MKEFFKIWAIILLLFCGIIAGGIFIIWICEFFSFWLGISILILGSTACIAVAWVKGDDQC